MNPVTHHPSPTLEPSTDTTSMVILVPVYENAGTLDAVVRSCAGTGLPVIIIDDGGRDGSAEIALGLVEQGVAEAVVRCPRNLGKAGALRLGFDASIERGFQTAITVDADGQHDPASILPMIDAIRNDPSMLVVGCRWPLHVDQPRRNLLGRTFSNVAIRAHAGVAVGDAPCGFRSWPLKETVEVRGRSGRYAWEQEMITRLAWQGVPIGSIDIPAIYHPRETRISHYRFGRDWPEGIAIYVFLLLVALIPSRFAAGRPTIRRFSRLLSPGPLRGRRPETATNRWFALAAMTGGLAAGLLLPASPWTFGILIWIGWRWHLGLAAIMLAVLPSALTIPSLAGTPSWMITVGAAWLLGGLLRKPEAVVDPIAR